jgi:hypothetical protein
LAIRKTTIPKTTVVPIIILGVTIGSFIVPLENQYYLNSFKTWCIPVIELLVLAFVIYTIVKARRRFKLNEQEGSSDFFTVLKMTCYEILPKVAVIPFVTEIAVFYYGFMHWKTIKLKPNEFSYHKDSGAVGLLMALVFLIAIETLAIHVLLAQWSALAAWILTGVSIYSAIQIFGFSKSMFKRPLVITNNRIYMRYGIMNETIINIKNVESVELSTTDIAPNTLTRKLSILGALEGHNIVITLNKENTLVGLYGIKKKYKILALHVDDKQGFKATIENLLKTEA